MSGEGEARSFEAAEARKLIAGSDGPHACVIDLRGEEDFSDGHIPAAVRIEEPRREDLEEAGRGRKDVETWILVCEDGKRSAEVARELCGDGVTVGWLDGGMKAWEGDGGAIQPRPEEAF